MSLGSSPTGDKPSPSSLGESSSEQAQPWPSPVHRSGGVCVDSTSGSKVRVNRENFGVGKTKPKPAAQASLSSEPDGEAGVVGVSHSSVDLLFSKKSREQRGAACSTHGGEAKDAVMVPSPSGTGTPDTVRELQIAPYRKAKASPSHRFWSLYWELSRRDVLERRWTHSFAMGEPLGWMEKVWRRSKRSALDGSTSCIRNSKPKRSGLVRCGG
jgi:hypothetical protein